jgi:hypothetical protein
MLMPEHSGNSISSTRLLRLSLGLCSGVSRAFNGRSLRCAVSPGRASRRFPEFPHVGIVAIGACVGSGDGECRRARGR